MEVKTTLKWDGDKVKIQGKKVVNKSSFETGLIVEGQAKLLINSDTGRLAASITVQSKDEGTSPSGEGAVASDKIAKPIKEGETLVGTPVFYGPYVEFGTMYADGNSFLRAAIALTKGNTLVAVLDKNGKRYLQEYLK